MQLNQQPNRRKVLRHASSRQRVAAAIVVLVVTAFFAFFWLAAHYKLDLSWWLGYCGFKQRTGLPCPTCGMTTSVLAFSQGRIWTAFHTQPAAAFLCCVIAVAAILALLVAVFAVYFRFLERFFAEVKAKHIILALIVIVVAGWAVTLARALAAGN
jgi:uncharacterized protein (DUF2062 family)